MSIKAFSKKKLEFTNPTEPNQKVKAPMMGFIALPDWVEADPLFHWAKQEGSIELMDEKSSKAKVKKSNDGDKIEGDL